jgi:hypothetical protein
MKYNSSCFNISHGGGGYDIKSQISANKHKRAVSFNVFSYNLTTFFINETFSKKKLKIAATEETFAYHTVQHNQIFQIHGLNL